MEKYYEGEVGQDCEGEVGLGLREKQGQDCERVIMSQNQDQDYKGNQGNQEKDYKGNQDQDYERELGLEL